MPSRPTIEIEPELLQEFMNKEVTAKQIAIRKGVCVSTAWSALLRAGYMPRSKKRKCVDRRVLLPIYHRFMSGEIGEREAWAEAGMSQLAWRNACLEIATILGNKKSRTTKVQNRAKKILNMLKSGLCLRDIAAKMRVSYQRVQQIITKVYDWPKNWHFFQCSKCKSQLSAKGGATRGGYGGIKSILCHDCTVELMKKHDIPVDKPKEE